jgi:hypothetical protein
MAIHDISEGRFASALAFLPMVSSAMTKGARLTVRSGKRSLGTVLDLENVLALLPRKYRARVLDAFEEAPIPVLLQRDLRVYRWWGGASPELGSHWFALHQYKKAGYAKRYLSLPAGNTAEHVSEFILPAGTVILIGKARNMQGIPGFGRHAVGGGVQIYVLDAGAARLVR